MSARIRFVHLVLSGVLLSLASASPAVAQQSAAAAQDPRWAAWLGCWQQLEETVRNENAAEPGKREAVPTKGVTVCVTPAQDPAAATFSTIVEKQAALEETVVADGSNQLIDEPACKGSQRVRWSANGRRLFARAELTCGDGTTRSVSGISTMAPGAVWVDLQVVNVDGQETIRLRRYRRSPDQTHVSGKLTREQLANAATATARQSASFSIEEVKEAVTKITPSTVEAALIETDSAFPLNAKRLQELDAAAVPGRVLDLMIALSFPNKFVVEKRASSSSPPIGGWFDPWDISGVAYGYYGFFDYYTMFPYYYYAPFGYRSWAGYDYFYSGGPVYVAPSPAEPRPSGEGRVVDGLGYTRVRSREGVPTGGMAILDGGGGGSSSGGSGSSSGGGVSGQGYSSGGGGADSGRTAVPRPPHN